MVPQRNTRSPSQAFLGRVLDQDRNKVPYAPGIQLTMLLLHDLLDEVARYFGKLLCEPVNDPGQRPHLFAYSHRKRFSPLAIEVKA
jgi:hypothetical protein